MKRTKSTVSFVSFKNVWRVLRPCKLPWPSPCTSEHNRASFGWVFVFHMDGPGRPQAFMIQCRCYWLLVLLIGLKYSILGLWTCTDYLVINSTNSLKGKGEKKFSYIFIVGFKKNDLCSLPAFSLWEVNLKGIKSYSLLTLVKNKKSLNK